MVCFSRPLSYVCLQREYHQRGLLRTRALVLVAHSVRLCRDSNGFMCVSGVNRMLLVARTWKETSNEVGTMTSV